MQRMVFEKLDQLSYMSKEAYKTLRTNIQFCGTDIQAICFTSSMPNEGKSSVSFRVAQSLAENDKKVIFVDADLRRSTIIGRYKPDQAVNGMTHYLSGQRMKEEIIYETNIDNLNCIFTGPVPPNPSELLGSNNFQNLLESLREEYDYIIIDTPPIGSVVDGIIVAKYCDGTIMVIESNQISYKLAQKIKQQLENVNCKVLGAVLNKATKDSSHYWGYQRKYRRYEKGYYAVD